MVSSDRTLEAWDERPPARSCFGYFGKPRNLEDGSEQTILVTAEEGKDASLETAGIVGVVLLLWLGLQVGFPALVTAIEAAGPQRFGATRSALEAKGRLLADVILPDGRNPGRELVAAGLASYYRKHSSDAVLHALETRARADRRGLRADLNPEAPWDHRTARAEQR